MLLSKPTSAELSGSQDRLSRVASNSSVNKDAYLNSTNKKFAMQYGDMYYVRLNTLRPIVLAELTAKHPGVKVLTKVLDSVLGERCAVIGTVYKEMKLKPSVLDEYAKDFSHNGQQIVANYTSDDDTIVIEDESGRLVLGGELIDPATLCTGVVIAAVGTETDNGFIVDDVCFPGLSPQPPKQPAPKDTFVVIAAGLCLGGDVDNSLNIQLLSDFLTGNLGGLEDHQMCCSIAAVIFAGNSVLALTEDSKKANAIGSKEQELSTNPVRELDVILSQCASSIPTFLMPGESDPSAYFLPQQPLHRCLLPSSHTFSSFQAITNPAEITINGAKIVGTSGQNVNDLLRYTRFENALDAIESTLNWRVIAPTAPDTLGCYPFMEEDPFLFKECPHIYFAANQAAFGSKMVSGPSGQNVRIISVPSFAKTGTAVLVNLNNLECEPIQFSAEI